MEFENKVVVVTGAAGNVGLATAKAFADKGATIALVDHTEENASKAQMKLSNTPSRAYACDLTQVDAVEQTFAAIEQQLGKIDVLANIAGGFTMGPTIQETSDKDWDFMMNLNLKSVFNTCRMALPGMLQNGSGRIINVAARAALQGVATMGPYCTSKAGVITLTETMAAENKDNDINVNCIMPGTVDTPQNRDAMPDANHDSWVPVSALADVIVFLASDASSCINGAAIPVYGKS